MLETSTSIILAVCICFATLATIICGASLAVVSPWWPRRSRFRGGSKRTDSPVYLLCRAVEALAITSSPPTASQRSRDASHRCSAFAENHSIPLRFQPDKLYGALSPRSSVSSFQPTLHRNSMVEALSPYLSTANQITTKGGFLAPLPMRIRSGSTSLLHEIGGFEGSQPILPIPAFVKTIRPQPTRYSSETTSALQIAKFSPSPDSRSSVGSAANLRETDAKHLLPTHTLDGMCSQERRKSMVCNRRTTLCTPIRHELGASLSELASIMEGQLSKSTHNSPSRKRVLSSAAGTPRHGTPTRHMSPPPSISCAEAPGGMIRYRVFVDATGKQNLTVRLHLHSASNLPSEKPWKNSNYLVKAALIGFKSHFVQTSGFVTAACGSPRFLEGCPSVLDFVVDCGVPFNQSEEEVRLQLMIIEFSGKKPGDRSVVVATNEYKFRHQTLKGMSTFSTDVAWKRCQPSVEVYQLNADVLTSLTQRESDDCLRFQLHEIRNMSFRLASDKFTTSMPHNQHTDNSNYCPVKLRLRACLVSNGKAIRVRKGFNIRLPSEYADLVREARDAHHQHSSISTTDSPYTNSLLLKDHVFSSSERTLVFRLPFPRSLGDERVCNMAGLKPIEWAIVAFFVLILEDCAAGNAQPPRRVRAIGRCSLGSTNPMNATTGESMSWLSSMTSETSQPLISQWLHVE